MRILIAVVIGVLLAGGASVGFVQVMKPSPAPVTKPLYEYGTR
ncbi:MAG TPA: hypothetical protein VH912_13985 [Streptosporangiaceae bacterium]|jgi:hypothetical protein